MIIKTKLDLNTTYYALCKYAEKITCPICNGQYERKIKQDNFEGVVKCKNCDYGKVDKPFYKIIPFKIIYCYWDDSGNPVESHLDVDKIYSTMLYDHNNPIYRTYCGYGDCYSDYYTAINETQLDKMFNTEEEAEQRLQELIKGEAKE